MALAIAKGYTFGTTEQVTAAKLHSLVDSATITMAANTTFVIGDGSTEGDWKFEISGSSFVFSRYTSGAWVNRGGF